MALRVLARGVGLAVLLPGCVMAADLNIPGQVQVTHTDRLNFPSGGALKMANSSGELVVEAWDQPGIEITTVKSTKAYYSGKAREEAARELDQVKITAEAKGNDIVISTVLPRHSKLLRLFEGESKFDTEYYIHVPRNARIEIAHDIGEVHIQGVTGEIHASVNMGLISVQVPQDAQCAIDAKTKLGSVVSDFAGDEKRERLLGHAFTASGGSQKLYLRAGDGDIMVLQLRIPKLPLS